MKFSREIEHAVLAAVQEAIVGKLIKHEDSYTKEQTTYLVEEAKPDRYENEPCLLVRCLPDQPEDGAVELIIRAGLIET